MVCGILPYADNLLSGIEVVKNLEKGEDFGPG